MKQILLIFAALLIILAIVTYVVYVGKPHFGSQNSQATPTPSSNTVTIDGHTFHVEVARTPDQQMKGLSGRNSLPQDQGMLFLFGQSTPDLRFWMKNMHFPLDIIFINGTKIVTIKQNLPPVQANDTNPPIYTPTAPADTVLEINAGLSKKYGFKEGDSIKTSL